MKIEVFEEAKQRLEKEYLESSEVHSGNKSISEEIPKSRAGLNVDKNKAMLRLKRIKYFVFKNRVRRDRVTLDEHFGRLWKRHSARDPETKAHSTCLNTRCTCNEQNRNGDRRMSARHRRNI